MNMCDEHSKQMHFDNKLDVSYAKQDTFSKVTVTVFENCSYS